MQVGNKQSVATQTEAARKEEKEQQQTGKKKKKIKEKRLCS